MATDAATVYDKMSRIYSMNECHFKCIRCFWELVEEWGDQSELKLHYFPIFINKFRMNA